MHIAIHCGRCVTVTGATTGFSHATIPLDQCVMPLKTI